MPFKWDNKMGALSQRHAKRLHPDVNKAADAHEQFARLGEAHEVLSDPERRRLYDLTGSSTQGVQ